MSGTAIILAAILTAQPRCLPPTYRVDRIEANHTLSFGLDQRQRPRYQAIYWRRGHVVAWCWIEPGQDSYDDGIGLIGGAIVEGPLKVTVTVDDPEVADREVFRMEDREGL